MVITSPFGGFVRKEELDKIRTSFKRVREELNEHLDAINQNTNEIQANYEYLCRIEAKLDAIAEKVEHIQLRLNELGAAPKIKQKINLSYEEKRVFLAIYKYSSYEEFISYVDLARKLEMTVSLVRFYVTNLIEKGVPIVKKYINREVLVSLDKEFRELQAKENIVNINENITRYI